MWNILFRVYEYFWFHTEFWIASKLDRRPYTYLIRDWIYQHPSLTFGMVLAWLVGLLVLCPVSPRWFMGLGLFSGMILAHLVWGSNWIEGQQENPPFIH